MKIQYMMIIHVGKESIDNAGNNEKELERKLISIGIDSSEKLIALESKQAFVKPNQEYPQVCPVHLYTPKGAIQNTEFNSLSEDKKMN